MNEVSAIQFVANQLRTVPNIGSAILQVAENVEFSTKNVANTNNGKLACAWALNHVVKLATGRSVLRNGSEYSLSTRALAKELENNPRYVQQELNQIAPGDICIAPSHYSKDIQHRGHAYVVGAKTKNGHLAWSNSSTKAIWTQYGTIENYASGRHGEFLKCYRVLY